MGLGLSSANSVSSERMEFVMRFVFFLIGFASFLACTQFDKFWDGGWLFAGLGFFFITLAFSDEGGNS